MLIIFLILLFIITVAGTLFVGLQENKKAEDYEKDGDSPAAQLKRSEEYEKSSLKTNVPILLFIYITTFLLAIIAIGLYIYFN